tara:strand:+ start:986 stop:1432 length:447 start_codon:yes stop_codon:yes gene_type:complete
MPSTSNSTNPAVLRYRGLDLEAMAALQMRNVAALRHMTNLMLDTTEAITRRQAEFLKSRVDHIGGAFKSNEGASDPGVLFDQQAEAYRDLFGALASHVGELAEITSNCCAGLVHEASRAATGQGEEGDAVRQPENDGTAASKSSTAKK